MMRVARAAALRLVAAGPTLLVVVAGAFALIALSPGDAVDAYLVGAGGDAGFAARLRESYGSGAPLLTRLLAYGSGLLHGDLGRSLIYNRPVSELLAQRGPNSLALMIGALGVAAGLGLLLGCLAGARPEGWRDRLIGLVTLTLFALPNFWLALLLILVFALYLPLLPVSGFGDLSHLVLPSLALGAGYIALYQRALRAGMVAAWRSPVVRSARARGLDERAVLRRAVLRPALLPVVAVAAQNVAALAGGSIVIEAMFAIPGLGQLSVEAVRGRDPLLLAGVLLIVSLIVVLVQSVGDALMALLDPRIGAGHA